MFFIDYLKREFLRQNLAVRYLSAFAAGREASTAKVKMMTTAKEDF
jgi:hypothetical protein